MHCALHADVVVHQVGGVTGATGGAMEIIVTAAHSANSTVVAVVGLFGEVVFVKRTLCAGVGAK